MHTAHKGVWTPQFWSKLLENFLSFSATFIARTKCDKNPQTLKLRTSPNPSPLVAAAENIPQVLPFRHQFENLRPCVVDVRCEEPDTVAS